MQELVKERLLVREPIRDKKYFRGVTSCKRNGDKRFSPLYRSGKYAYNYRAFKRDCGISFMYKIAVADELKNGTLKEIRLSDFKMQHAFDFIWEKGSIYTEKYIGICEELLKKRISYID